MFSFFGKPSSFQNDTTRLPPESDVSRLIHNSTSSTGRNVISKLYDESASKSRLLNASHEILNKDTDRAYSNYYTGNTILEDTFSHRSKDPPFLPPKFRKKSKVSFADVGSSTLRRDLEDDPDDLEPLNKESLINRVRKKDLFGTGHLSDQELQVIKHTNHKNRPLLTFGRFEDVKKKVDLRALKRKEQEEIENYWLELEKAKGHEKTVKYIKDLTKKMEVMEDVRNQYRDQKKANELEETEFKKWVNQQRKVDEERRKEIENELRKVIDGQLFYGSTYNPVEGFLFAADFVMTKTSRFENLYLRYSVWLVGQKLTETWKTTPRTAEDYAANVLRVFIGEQRRIETIEPDPETFLIIEMINQSNKGDNANQELVGWTLIKLFNDQQGLLEKKWYVPLFLPPTQFAATPGQMISNLFMVEGTKLFVRISHPRNKDLNYKIKKSDPLDKDYESSPFYLILHREPRFYKEWLERQKKKKAKAKKVADDVADDIGIIKKYLDDEDKMLIKEKGKEDEKTKKVVDKATIEAKKEKEEMVKPLKKANEDIKKDIGKLQALKDIGKLDEIQYNVLDDLPGKKTGLKITVNNVFNLRNKNPLKIQFDVYMENELLFDEFGNPCKFLLPLVDGHVDYDKFLLDVKPKRDKKKRRKRIDVDVDEIWYVVKDIKGLIKYFELKKHVYIVFHVYEIKGRGKLKKKKENNYKVFEKRTRVGWVMFRVTTEPDKVIKEGRYKLQLQRIPVRKPPPNPAHENRRARSWFDFTIETFEYETWENQKFAYRRRKKRKKKKVVDDGYDRRPFIPNDEPQYLDYPFEKGAGIDFYVDSARYLPNSMTVSKILVRIVDADIRDVIFPTTKVSKFASDIFNPDFNMRIELRLPFFNPTLMVIITLMTVDKRDDEGKPSIVGHGFFPLFIDSKTKQQPERSNNRVS